ncbi:MAG: DNA mismatch repair endonuclease MutL [Algicola sp.]|nr:DNA mismatch repair endonuclease MutL [Algicola sp.]
MTIQILPARLANQIAAGEVVERPASVIKELLENSLDAGATTIDIEIEKGGSKLIRIRDNGAGIAKGELTLALSRHATSKVSSFDDLENITSLGFRGEALASISSVSRLKLTSKPAQQSEAWQAYAEGRDMQVNIIPAAHPQGTTVEVVDLFFNTPARRKFLRTEKTEFYHIDELIKRIALSRFDVQFSLKHNGKTVRHLRPAQTDKEQDRRIGQICSKGFLDSVVRLNCDYDGVSLTGWVVLPSGCRSQNDVQYSYVNGRMMRDKLINHAIRQAYGQQLNDGQYPTYVLFLTVSPRQIDVNVHPAKHEVRFHQARLIHDFIVQALEKAINPENVFEYGSEQIEPPTISAAGQINEPPAQGTLYPRQQGVNDGVVAESALSSRQPPPEYFPLEQSQHQQPVQEQQARAYQPQGGYQGKQPGVEQLECYHQALTSFSTPIQQETASPTAVREENTTDKGIKKGRSGCLSVINGHFALYQSDNRVFLLDLDKVNGKVAASQYSKGLVGQPLLLPVKMLLDKSSLLWLQQQSEMLNLLGIDFECLAKAVVIRKVPSIIRNRNISDSLSQLFAWLQCHGQDKPLALPRCIQWLFSVLGEAGDYDLVAAIQLIATCLQQQDEQQLLDLYGVQIGIDAYITQLANLNGSTSE